MKTKNKRKSNLKSLLLLLLLTAVILISSTYAWFTANPTVTVQSMNVNIQAQNGLEISADAVNWKSIIQTADLLNSTTLDANYATWKNQIPTSQLPVSTGGSVADVDTGTGYLGMYWGEVDTTGTYKLTATQETDGKGTSGKYIAFDLFFRVNKPTDVLITTDSSVNAVGTDKGIQNATRIAFIDHGSTPSSSTSAAMQALKAKRAVHLWEPNYDVHSPTGVANALWNYGQTTTETGATALVYKGIIDDIALGDGVLLAQDPTDATEYDDYLRTVVPTIQTKKSFSSDGINEDLFQLDKGVTKIRIYMWIEGQDVDCENSASGTDIEYKLQITTGTVYMDDGVTPEP